MTEELTKNHQSKCVYQENCQCKDRYKVYIIVNGIQDKQFFLKPEIYKDKPISELSMLQLAGRGFHPFDEVRVIVVDTFSKEKPIIAQHSKPAIT